MEEYTLWVVRPNTNVEIGTFPRIDDALELADILGDNPQAPPELDFLIQFKKQNPA